MPVKVRQRIVIDSQDAKFVFKPMVLADIANFGENTPQAEVLNFVASKIESWDNVIDENDKPLECNKDNFVKLLPLDVSTNVLDQLMEKMGMGKKLEKK